jgi:tetratricopeptide (TPR) repeat protein
VRCALEVQHTMVERNAGVAPEKRIEFRIGIHLGDVVEESDGDLMGDGVNIAAWLEGVCEPGAICLSEDAYRQVRGRLDLAVGDLGQTQLKNIAEPIRVYSLRVGIPAHAKPAIGAKSDAPKKRSVLIPLAVGIAALLVLIGGAAWWFLNANRPAAVASKAPPGAARTLRADPSLAVAYWPMAVGQELLGHYEQSISDLEQAIRISPRDSNLGTWRTEMGRALLGLRRCDAAVEEGLIGIDSGFRTVLSYTALAAFYAAENKMPEAKAALAEAIKLNPKLSVAWFRSRTPSLIDSPPGFREALIKAGLPEE